MKTISDEGLYLQVTTPLDSGGRKFIAEEVFGDESLSGLFHYRLKLRTADNKVDFAKILGKAVTVSIEQYSGTIRYINGIVTCFRQSDNDGAMTTYYAELRPWFWQLSLTTDSRIFQNKTAKEIITAIFSDNGFSDHKDSTSGAFAKREYCVQYQETALDFVSRLMEDEGIFYYFEHTKTKHTLVMANAASAHKACPGLKEARYTETDPIAKADDLIDTVMLEQSLVTNKFAAEDFNFETPETDLLTVVKGKSKGKLRVYEYPGEFLKTADGEKIVSRRIEALEVPGKVLSGDGYCRAFICGYKFKMSGHDRADINGEYVLRWLSIQANQDSYANSFEAFPAAVPFRPPRLVKKPKIFGSQTAVVVGKKGEEIWPDKYGRVKVQFHWDQEGKKDENSSCWVRVAQVWAGKSWGTLFIPRMGAEVVVSFLEGNPDRPLIIGTVYNATQTVPYAMPGDKNKSTIKTISTKKGKAGNEIRFDDTKDKEELYVHAQKDYNIKVENDRKKEVLGKETIDITKDRTTTIKEGNESFTVSKGDRTVTITKGSETHSVKAKRGLTVTGAETHTNKDGFTHSVKKNYELKVDGNLTINVKGTINIVGKKDITIKASGNVTNQAGKSLTNKASMALTNKAGTALTNQAGTSLDNKAGTALTNKGGTTLTNQAGLALTNKGLTVESKGSASAKVEGGGMLTLKGGMVKVG
ncbi:MAG: type VI secretion system tip protein VgrG [Desulfobacterales bacterium]|nr:type VI secretion system tip protein VgrG [Desulfobacterales bacterium]